MRLLTAGSLVRAQQGEPEKPLELLFERSNGFLLVFVDQRLAGRAAQGPLLCGLRSFAVGPLQCGVEPKAQGVGDAGRGVELGYHLRPFDFLVATL